MSAYLGKYLGLDLQQQQWVYMICVSDEFTAQYIIGEYVLTVVECYCVLVS